MPIIKALATLPVNDRRAASAGLRGRLRLIVDRSGSEPLWDTLHIAHATSYRDARGREWFQWVATLEVQAPATEASAEGAAGSRATVNDLGLLRQRPPDDRVARRAAG